MRRVTPKRVAIGAVLLGVTFVVLAVLASFVYAPWQNNRDMDAWTGAIFAASEIEGAVVVDQGSRFGIQPGTNGNHCDREAWLVYDTDLAADAIKNHFDSHPWQPRSDLGPGSARVSAVDESRLIRVDFWFRFETGIKAGDPRCW